MRKLLYILCATLMLAASCRSEQGPDPAEQARRDSAALHVALMPVLDCLPIYYAQRQGIYDSLGLDLRISTLQAQLDTDTALTRRHAHLAYSDMVRAIVMQQSDTIALRVVAGAEGALSLVTPRRGRVRSIGQLRERMVAVARHSITDFWSDRLTDTASMERDAIFRPQINNVRIRTDMLINGTMDAAFLPEPYASEMAMLGAQTHLATRTLSPRLAAYVAPAWVVGDSSRVGQLRLLLRGYDIAAARLNAHQRDSLRPLLRELCFVPDTLADSLVLRLPPLGNISAPRQSDAEAALKWFESRGRSRQGYTTDTLMSAILFQ